MVLLEELKDRGWFLSAEGLEECTDGLENPKADDVIRKAVNFDLVDIGEGGLPEDVSRNKVESITGPVVVQIQKIRNVAAPKSNPESDHSPRLLRLHLTDGTSYCSAVQWGRWSNISLSTPPGSKILLKEEPIPVVNGFLLLAERNFKFLGGNVAHLIEKWELAKNLSHHKRIVGDEGAAPPWVPFGQKIEAGGLKNLKGSFKSMDLCQKDTKPNESFEKHRQMTIAEISRAKEGKVKVFGGGKQQPQDGDIAQLVGFGYSVDAAVNALKTHNCDIAAAMQALELSDRNRRERANKPEMGRKRREPRDRDSADEKAPSRPSGPSTLFDYLQNQISLPKVPDVEDAHVGDRPSSEANPSHEHPHQPDRSQGSSRGRAANGPSANGGRFGQQQHGPSQRYRGQEPRRGDGGDHSYQNHFHDGPSGYHSNSSGPYNRHREGGGNGPGQQPRSNQGGYGNRNQARQPPPEAGDRRRPPPPQSCDLAPGSRPPPRERSYADSKPPGPKRLYSGQKVLAKYWEDSKFYRAIVHEVSANGNTCVVKFVDYGNHEEVLCSDVQTVSLAQWEKGQSSSSQPDYHRRTASGTGSSAGGDGPSHQQGPPAPPPPQQQQRHFNSSRDSEDYRYLEAMMQNEAAAASATQHHPQPPPPQQQQQQPSYHHNYHHQQQHHHQQYQPQHQRPPGDSYEHGGYRQRPPPHHKPQHQPFGGAHGRPQQQFYQPPAQRRQGPPA